MDNQQAIDYLLKRLEQLQFVNMQFRCEDGALLIGKQLRLLFAENEYKQVVQILKGN